MIGRLIAIVLLCIVGVVGLGMSLCGGAITFAGLVEGGGQASFRRPRSWSSPCHRW